MLIEADTEDEARREAERLGKTQDVSFPAVSGELVTWEFVRVTDIHEIQDEYLKHGTEVFSRFLRSPIG